MPTNPIYNEIDMELEYAHSQWGDKFDSKNTLNDWVTYITMYASESAKMANSKAETRKKLIKAAGLCVSALKWLDSGKMPPRHYDDSKSRPNTQGTSTPVGKTVLV